MLARCLWISLLAFALATANLEFEFHRKPRYPIPGGNPWPHLRGALSLNLQLVHCTNYFKCLTSLEYVAQLLRSTRQALTRIVADWAGSPDLAADHCPGAQQTMVSSSSWVPDPAASLLPGNVFLFVSVWTLCPLTRALAAQKKRKEEETMRRTSHKLSFL